MHDGLTHHDMSLTDPREREDRWEFAMSADYAAVSVQARPMQVPPGSNFLARQDLDDLRLVDLASTTCRARRRARMNTRDTLDSVAILFVRQGRECITVEDTTTALDGGDVALWDPNDETSFEVRGSVLKWNLIIPRTTFRATVGRAGTCGVLPRSPVVRVLSNLVGHLSQSLPEMTPREITAARNATLELLGGALSPHCAVPDAAREPLRASVDEWVERHLDCALTPTMVATAHAVSTRTLNRLFQSEGETFGSYVRDRRLARARGDLVRTADAIATIAHRWRFADASHFTRRYLEHFGEPPSAVRAARAENREGSANRP